MHVAPTKRDLQSATLTPPGLHGGGKESNMEEITRVTSRNLLIYGYDEDGEPGFMDMEDGIFYPVGEDTEVLGDDAFLHRVEDGEWKIVLENPEAA